jgi:hypothetical protein
MAHLEPMSVKIQCLGDYIILYPIFSLILRRYHQRFAWPFQAHFVVQGMAFLLHRFQVPSENPLWEFGGFSNGVWFTRPGKTYKKRWKDPPFYPSFMGKSTMTRLGHGFNSYVKNFRRVLERAEWLVGELFH